MSSRPQRSYPRLTSVSSVGNVHYRPAVDHHCPSNDYNGGVDRDKCSLGFYHHSVRDNRHSRGSNRDRDVHRHFDPPGKYQCVDLDSDSHGDNHRDGHLFDDWHHGNLINDHRTPDDNHRGCDRDQRRASFYNHAVRDHINAAGKYAARDNHIDRDTARKHRGVHYWNYQHSISNRDIHADGACFDDHDAPGIYDYGHVDHHYGAPGLSTIPPTTITQLSTQLATVTTVVPVPTTVTLAASVSTTTFLLVSTLPASTVTQSGQTLVVPASTVTATVLRTAPASTFISSSIVLSIQPASTVTTTIVQPASTVSAVSTFVSAVPASTITQSGQTITLPASTIIGTLTIVTTAPASSVTRTFTLATTLPASTVVSVATVASPLAASTITESGAVVVIPATTVVASSVVTLTVLASTVTVSGQTTVLPGSTVVVTSAAVQTLPPSTVTLPGQTIVVPASGSIAGAISGGAISSGAVVVVTITTSLPASVFTTTRGGSTITGTAPGSTTVITQTVSPSSPAPTTPAVTVTTTGGATGTTYTVTTTLPSIIICAESVRNPSYTPPAPLPTDYTWGCPPGSLCRPPRVNCNVDETLPDAGYVCSPGNCIPAPALKPIQYWGEPVASNQTDGYRLQDGYFNLDPRTFGLDYNIFTEDIRVIVAPDGSVTSSVLNAGAQGVVGGLGILQRRATKAPAACYDDCNACPLEAEHTGKTPALCASDSAFSASVSGCQACIARHSSLSDYRSVVQPKIQQWLDYCTGTKVQAVVLGGGDTGGGQAPQPQVQGGAAVAAGSAVPAAPAL
ncbi:MAG: hypothetical protein M1826_006056, partial [Phylliscum demangeonii]